MGRDIPDDEVLDHPSKERSKGPDTVRPSRAQILPPAFMEPALATLVDTPPEGPDWLFEAKFDGYRAVVAASGQEVRIHTRSGLDWTDRFPTIVQALAALDLPPVLLDGEIVALDSRGLSSFNTLQRAMKDDQAALSYYVFDLLAEAGRDWGARPLVARKARLAALLGETGKTGPVFYTDHVMGGGAALLATLCEQGFEGIIAKRASAPYHPGRGHDWLKVKCGNRQEFVIVGWSPSTHGRAFASLLLGLREDGALRYAGRVGSGFDADTQAGLEARLHALGRKSSTVAVDSVPPAIAREARWVKPELVAEIAFAGFTADQLVRQGRFLGLRGDKPAKAVVLEKAEPVGQAAKEAGPPKGQVPLTHPERVLDPVSGLTKQDLADYLETVASRMLPYAAGRLLSLLRCPEGTGQACFFQRHAASGTPAWWRRKAVKEKDGGQSDYFYLTDAAGLRAAAQMGVLELHLWGSQVRKLESPDRLVFDLDPDVSLPFAKVKAAAVAMRDVLAALDLVSFPLLTGGKGVHVVAPLGSGAAGGRRQWPVVAAFAKAVAEQLVEANPDAYVATMSKARRQGRIFIDHFRNTRGSSAIAPYSTRAKPARAGGGTPVACPVSWEELAKVERADFYTTADAPALMRRADPWARYFELEQDLGAAACRVLGVKVGAGAYNG
ncbi:DNA ligase D [Nitrospirillum amazonense]|uniref:DNA ligase D n=1 Tax=Nitrospirillum amazonense TaxID=28077 RepID=UPI002412D814|nr:DNA ligase D [Nitrospirillum amazonense]MDG3442671.1 DNA ligase D [Nitrospirillum amazonense]